MHTALRQHVSRSRCELFGDDLANFVLSDGIAINHESQLLGEVKQTEWLRRVTMDATRWSRSQLFAAAEFHDEWKHYSS